MLADVPVLPVDRRTAGEAARIAQLLDRTGVTVATADVLIAGMALNYGVPVLTRNRRHFDRIPGLAVESPA